MILEAEEFKQQGIEDGVYPDNWTTYTVLYGMLTQWNVGMSGATGLRYEVLQTLPEVRRMDEDQYDDMFWRLQVMERAALKHMRENK